MQYFKDDEVEHGLKYICDEFNDFKYHGNEVAMKEILMELPVKLSAFLNSCEKNDERLLHLHTIIGLINDNKEFMKQLDKNNINALGKIIRC